MQGADLVTAAAGLLSASSSDYKSLIIYRSLLGFGVGGGHVFTSWFLEFIPASSRGAWMIGISTFWTIGTLMGASLAWVSLLQLKFEYLSYIITPMKSQNDGSDFAGECTTRHSFTYHVL